jgi:hypothetical protein
MSPHLLRIREARAGDTSGGGGPDPELLAQRERLTERFALMQSELGGLFYEMAIRDHVQMDVLVTKAAELQHLDAELSRLEDLLRGDAGPRSGHCASCGASRTHAASFCWQCGTALRAS